jgi:hypothetical protein
VTSLGSRFPAGNWKVTILSLPKGILWGGSARDYIDLQGLLPAPWNRSWAMDITVEGSALRILGTVSHLVQESHLEIVRAERLAVWEADLRTES